jgi:hypothetical protein
MKRTAFLLAALLTSTFVAACSSSETIGTDAGTGSGGTTAAGGSGVAGQTGGGTTGSAGTTGAGGESGSGSGGVGTGGSTGPGIGGRGGAAGGAGAGPGGSTGVGGSGAAGTHGAGGTTGPGSGGKGGTAGGAGKGGAVGGTAGGGGQAAGAGGGGTAGGGGGTAAYNPCPTNGDPCKVLPLGDSITYGLITIAADEASSDPSINGKDSHGGYRVELFSDAVAAGKNLTFVGSQMNGPTTVASMPFPKSHEGWSGFTIAQIQGKAANDLTYGPHIILVHAGTNDTYMSDPSGAPARLSTLVDYLTTNFPNALVVVAKIIPYPSQASNVNLINQSIPAMVQSKVSAGKHVIVADLNTGFNTSTMLAGDGVHPNQSGYNWMGDTWYSTIGNLLR